MNLSVPQYFSEKLTTIDNICSTRALGALRNSPDVFLRHDLDMQTPEIRLSAKIANMVALIAKNPPHHPLHHVYYHAQRTSPTAHKGPLHAYFML